MWDQPGAARKLAACMVDVWEATRKKFSVDEQRHYLFTPRDLTAWLRGLLRYELASPCISLYLPASPRISLHLPVSPSPPGSAVRAH